jgi:hypothetical protein
VLFTKIISDANMDVLYVGRAEHCTLGVEKRENAERCFEDGKVVGRSDYWVEMS